jgi:glycosyltransferase involved in cell wall biosynthesis
MKKDNQHLLSVVIPAYKQEKTIVEDLKRIQKVLAQLRYNYEIVVVVDGFMDNTFKEAEKLCSRKIKIVGYKKNKGKGFAVRYGMARSRGDLIAFIDAGMDINPNGLSMILEHMEWYNAEVILGSKLHPASRVPSYPLIRKIYSRGYHLLTRLLFGLKLRDTQAGLKIYQRKVLEKVLPRLLVKTHAFDVEILSVARRLGFKRIYEAPIEIDPKKFTFSSTISLEVVKNMLLDTLAVFYRLRILRYYDDDNKRQWIYDPDLNFRVNVG